MHLSPSLGQLTYCSNIHPGERFSEIENNLKQYLPAVKAAVSPDTPFGVGLRLSAQAVAELMAIEGAIATLKRNLDEAGLYVFTLNGFPYGPFHGTPVKDQVYRPDWRSDERLQYSNRLAEVLCDLLPPTSGGTISTVPGAYKAHVSGDEDRALIRTQLVRHAAYLYKLEETRGRCIALALEPEPCCLLETIAETTDFFRTALFDERSISEFAALTGNTRSFSAELLPRYLGVCLDTCHAAVEFEDPASLLQALRDAHVDIKKMQLSAGLRVPQVNATHISALADYADPVYLHQVVERRDNVLHRYTDLDEAMQAFRKRSDEGDETACEWRIHFHVPIFLRDTPPFENTQDFLETLLRLHRKSPFTEHLEVETYTWSVLPKPLQTGDLVSSIVRELSWARDILCNS